MYRAASRRPLSVEQAALPDRDEEDAMSGTSRRRAGRLHMAMAGRTTVPELRGMSWHDTCVAAARHRVIRCAQPLTQRATTDSLASWIVVDQDPPAWTAVPIGSTVTVVMQRPDAELRDVVTSHLAGRMTSKD
jgi:hypothetical protein